MRKQLILWMIQIVFVCGQDEPSGVKSERLTSKERKSLIGHLQGLDSESTVICKKKSDDVALNFVHSHRLH